MARRFVVSRNTKTRRATQWLGIDAGVTTFTAIGGTVLASLNAAALALRPFTVIRSHVELNIASDQQAATENQIGAYGICVVTDQALAIGNTAVPTPVTDSSSDAWFVHQWFMNAFRFSTAAGLDPVGGARFTIDSKAMRKVEEGFDLALVAEFSAAGEGFNLLDAGRILVKLH